MLWWFNKFWTSVYKVLFETCQPRITKQRVLIGMAIIECSSWIMKPILNNNFRMALILICVLDVANSRISYGLLTLDNWESLGSFLTNEIFLAYTQIKYCFKLIHSLSVWKARFFADRIKSLFIPKQQKIYYNFYNFWVKLMLSITESIDGIVATTFL